MESTLGLRLSWQGIGSHLQTVTASIWASPARESENKRWLKDKAKLIPGIRLGFPGSRSRCGVAVPPKPRGSKYPIFEVSG